MADYLHDRVVAAVGDHYLIESELGRGGMAAVYRAVDLRLNRPVAIKVLPPELAFNADVRTRFLREAQTAAQLSHPNIVPIYSVDERAGVVFFVMALVDGESVGARLAREGRLGFGETKRILRDVADALAYAHGRGVIHRDIKPDNILLDRASGRPLVTDFGIARAAASDTRLTVTGVAVGTPAYMSPEQALGERELDQRSDIYSLGVVGYHMLTGAPPFAATNTPAMLVKHVSERPRPVRERRPDTPPALAVAIDHALAKRPDDRWSSADDFRDALAGLRTTPVEGGVAPGRAGAAPEPPRVDASDDARARARATARSIAREVERDREAERDLLARDAERWAMRPIPPMPPMPTFGGRRAMREWRRAQREAEGARRGRAWSFDERPIAERITIFRRKFFSTATTVPLLAGINMMTDGPPWFLIPTFFMGMDLLRKTVSLWGDGVGPLEALRRGRTRALEESAGTPRIPAPPPPTAEEVALRLVGAAVLAGPHGAAARRAAADQLTIQGIVERLTTTERELLPDVKPTVDALVDRISALATTLHNLDADMPPGALEELERRITTLRAPSSGPDQTPTAERERRVALLERQRSTLQELAGRRATLVAQLESAGIALSNLRLDLLKLRSAGVDAALGDVTSATQQARAVSRDIGYVLDAADDVNKL